MTFGQEIPFLFKGKRMRKKFKNLNQATKMSVKSDKIDEQSEM